MNKALLPIFACLFAGTANAQLVINGGSVTIGDNASIVVQGDFTSNTNVLGTGKVILNGTALQRINTNGASVPNLEINSAANVILAGDSKISNELLFTNGKIQTGNYNLILGNTAVVTGAGTGKFVETNGTGQVRQEIAAAGTYMLPVGSGSSYMPLQYLVSGGNASAGAYVGTQLVGGSHPNKPVRSTDYLQAYWKPVYSGITGARINVTGSYNETTGITGDETMLNGIRYTGTDWSLANASVNQSENTVTYSDIASGAELYAMNKFVLMNAKVFLQGAYNSATGKMNDALRLAPSQIPLSDPYRTAPYSNFFNHNSNTVVEVAEPSVFNDQLSDDDNIVDWVFLELRDASNTLIQTRSALLQKDGDVVDVDGVNPVFFKNINAADYIITVRHRNHLGLAADAASYTKTLSVAKPAGGNMFDLRTATDAQVYGDGLAYTTASHPTLGTVNLLWGGNANSNGSTRYTGPSNDNGYLLTNALSGNSSSVLNPVYSSADLNLNRNVRFTGPSNDHGFLITNVLGGNTSKNITQQIPN